MENKLGSYVSNLMTTILDEKQEEFIKNLAWNELKSINSDIEEFLRKHSKDDLKDSEKTVKQLLQEEKDVKNK